MKKPAVRIAREGQQPLAPTARRASATPPSARPRGLRPPLLALDLATATGWALRDVQGNLTSGTQRFDLRRGDSPGMRWIRFRAWLRDMLKLGGLRRGDVLAYEQPLAAHRGGLAAALAHGLAAIVQEVAAEEGVELASVPVATLKKASVGRGNAKKPEMIAGAKRRWPDQVIEDDNQADALWVLAWAQAEMGEK